MPNEVRVVALLKVLAGEEGTMEQAARACITATRQEPGCLAYALHRNVKDPQHFAFIETWQDQAALSEHSRQPHLKAFKDAITPIMQGELQVMMFEAVA